MERREFVQKLGVGSAVALVAGGAVATGTETPAAAASEHTGQSHDHEPVRGPMATATVTFGSWRSDNPFDRYPNVSAAAANAHLAIPYQVTIKPGGTVTFAISGLHQILVYAPDVKPEHINTSLLRPTTGTPAGTPLINDPANRLYAGLDPSLHPRDRVEVVQFHAPGRYLVICGVLTHFVNNQMFGWVRVRPGDDDEN